MLTENNTSEKIINSQNASLSDIELKLIQDALVNNKGSITKATDQLGISYKTMQYRIGKFKLDKKKYK